MSAVASPSLRGKAAPSPAGPASDADLALPPPPVVPGPRVHQMLRFQVRQIEYMTRSRREHGDVFELNGLLPGRWVVTSHPDHVASIFKAKPDLVPTLVPESPLRPLVGPNSVLTANGARHLRQRKLLLPPFHGEAIERYRAMIVRAAHEGIDGWAVGTPIALAPLMQAITLDVIMAGIFGIEGRPARGTAEHGLRTTTRRMMNASTMPGYQVEELLHVGRDEPILGTKLFLTLLDRHLFSLIRLRRADPDLQERLDILSLILRARTEDGEPLTDQEVRDEVLGLVLAGHETTANQLAWAWERLTRTPEAHERLVTAVREDQDAAQTVDDVLHETMRARPVVPIIGRRATVPWRLGDHHVPADTALFMSILLVHHREDLYPEPYAFRPERWREGKPGTYDWLPFGGGTRRCLGAALAWAEMQEVLRATAARLDLVAAEPEPERALHRNVTMIPRWGGRVVVRSRSAHQA